jgi:hypothetical protein
MGDVEIQIRRSTKPDDACNKKEEVLSTSVKSPPPISYQNGDQEKKTIVEEKPAANPTYWDYSATHGKQNKNLYIKKKTILYYT